MDGQRRIGEASVWYLFSETAAAEIKAFNPEARILVLLREPVEMMYSIFNYFRFDGNEPLATFQEALEAEPDRRAGRRLGRQTRFVARLVYVKSRASPNNCNAISKFLAASACRWCSRRIWPPIRRRSIAIR